MSPNVVADRLAQLRNDFDRSFAAPARRSDAEHAELLAVRAGGRPYALRLSQTAGLYPDRPVTPLPGPVPALLGVAGFGGVILPVYDLAALLGHPVPDRARWLVLAAGTPPLALAFHELDGHVRVPADTIMTEAGADPTDDRPADEGRSGGRRADDGPAGERRADDGPAGERRAHDGRAGERRAGGGRVNGGRGCVRGMVPLAGGTRPIVDLSAARAAVHALSGHTGADDGPAGEGKGQT
jgi:chemotaxis signal transduction protein